MIIDAHAHLSESEYGNAENYLMMLNRAGIDGAVVVPGGMLDVRRMTDYITGRAKPEQPIPNNRYVEIFLREHPGFAGFYCVNPHLSGAVHELETALCQGFRGLKLSPMSHEFSFAGKSVADLVACAGQHGYPVYSHVVFSPGAATARFVALARQFPQTNFILGHMGFGPADQEGLEAAGTLPNFYLETSTANFLHLKEAVRRIGAGKLIFGSEYPLSHPVVELQKIMLLDLPDSDREKILGGNIHELLKMP